MNDDDFNWLPQEEEQEAAQQSRRGLFRFLPRFRRGRGGAAASAPSEESSLSGRRGLFRLIPRFLRRARSAPTEATAADLALEMGERPVEQLDDRLLALRERAQSRPEQETVSPREALYDVDDVLVRPEIIHRPGGVISPLALSKAQQEQVELLRDMVGGTALPDDSQSEGGLLSRGKRLFSLGAIPHLLVSILMLLALALPFVATGFSEGELPPLAFHEDRHGTTTAFNMLDNLTLDDYVLLAFEYGPTAAGELDELADVILRHIFAQGSKAIIVSSNPITIVHARNVIAAIERSVAPVSTRLVENQDYYLLRFLSGGALGLRDLSRNFGSIVNTSARGMPTGLGFTSLDEMTLMVLIAERAEDVRHWAEQVATETDSDFIAATGYAAQPLAEPYVYAHEDIVGMFIGVRDAYTYNQILQANYADYELPPRREDPGTGDGESAPTPSPTPTATATATPTATPTPTATETPQPQATPTPTATPTEPEPELVQLAVAPAATATQIPSPVAEVIAQGPVNIRRRPNTASDILALAATGDIFPVLGENGDGSWINILLPDGIEAWIASFLVEQYIAPADGTGGGAPDGSARAGDGQTVLQFDFSLRLGKTRPRFYQANPPAQGDRAEFVLLRDGRQEEQRLDAMTLGTIAAVLVIVAGNVFYMMRALTRRRRASQGN
ncbi:MAG: SH3 domain-containing protein [Chloroflexi bacterium]|nr:SH3 domain-containing protein [Chloroflexota bacterium]